MAKCVTPECENLAGHSPWCTEHAPICGSFLLGKLIAARLKEMGHTQTLLAAQLDINPSVIGLWTSEQRLVPGYRLDALADALELTVETLLNAATEVRNVAPKYHYIPEAEVETPEPYRPRQHMERLEAYALGGLYMSGPSPVQGRPKQTA
jgi:transcriptional regulator with XRE-family HTH domain